MKNDQAGVVAVTHDGVFHCDEVLALALLRIAAHPNHVAIIRSRLPKDWERADFVIDVGSKYDGIKWFDHHMPEGAGVRVNGIPFSAFGLIWNAFGVTAVRQLLSDSLKQHQLTDKEINEVVEDIASFVAGVDAHDQGLLSSISKFSQNKSVNLEVPTLQQIISNFNPVPLLEPFGEALVNQQFHIVIGWAQSYLQRFILRKASRVLAEPFVKSYDKGEAVLVLPHFCDWNVPVASMKHVLFVVYPSMNGESYTIQAAKKGSGQNKLDNLRLPFPQAWAGLNKEELQKVSGVSDAVFCHRNRFIAAAMTLQGAITLAKIAIKLDEHK